MKLAQFTMDGGARVGVVVDGGVLDLTRAFQVFHLVRDNRQVAGPAGVTEVLASGAREKQIPDVVEVGEQHGLVTGLTVNEPRLTAPIDRANKVIAMSSNFPYPGEADAQQPMFFFKLGSTVVGPDEAIVHRRDIGTVEPE